MKRLRIQMLMDWRHPELGLEALVLSRTYYARNPVDFICHWVDTYDPRNATDGSSHVPFVLFRRQREFVEFLMACMQAQTGGLVEKSRDVGATWLCCAFSIWLWLFVPGSSVGWGSRKSPLVDDLGVPDSIFEKMRMIIRQLPVELLPQNYQMNHMRIWNKDMESTITGESGDNIGRGGRKSMFFKDESSHYEHPELIEAALGDNTRVQIDISSVNGPGNVFHRRRESGVDWVPGTPALPGVTNVFVFDWSDHPSKTRAWYDQRRAKAEGEGLLHLFSQEVDRNYMAALEGAVIPGDWIMSAVDADKRLGFVDDGGWGAALDVADEGGDTNALAARRGVVLRHVDEWGARDVGVTTRKAVSRCAELGGEIDLQYDCVGLGSAVKAEANRLKDEEVMPAGLSLVAWNAGGEVLGKEKHLIPGDRQSPLRGDFFANLKAQGWWELRRRFEITHRAVRKVSMDATPEELEFTYDNDDLISLSSDIPLLRKLTKELAQVTWSKSAAKLKLTVDKKPDGSKSPNLADAVMMCYWPMPANRPIRFSPEVQRWAAQRAAAGGGWR